MTSAGALRVPRSFPLLLVAALLALPAGQTEAQTQEVDPGRRGQDPAATDAALESRYFDSGGLRLHYIDEGSGEPVVLIHGFSLDLRLNWVDPGVVSTLTEAGYRVLAYDFRGHGQSAKPHDETKYGPPEVRDPIRLLDHLGIDRAHVIGYSRGGLIAHRLLAERPGRLISVVLGGYGEGTGGEKAFDATTRALLAEALAQEDYRPLILAVAPNLPPEQVEAWDGLLRERNDGRALAAAFRADGSFPPFNERELRDNEVPTLAIVGEEDPFREGVERMAAAMGRLEVLVLPGADHASTLERPEFVTAVLGFLAKQGKARACICHAESGSAGYYPGSVGDGPGWVR